MKTILAAAIALLMALPAFAQSTSEPADPFAKFSWKAPTHFENGSPLTIDDLSHHTLTCSLISDPEVSTSKQLTAKAATLQTAKEDLFPQYGAYSCRLTSTSTEEHGSLTSRPSEPVTVTYIEPVPVYSPPNPPTNVLFITEGSAYFE